MRIRFGCVWGTICRQRSRVGLIGWAPKAWTSLSRKSPYRFCRRDERRAQDQYSYLKMMVTERIELGETNLTNVVHLVPLRYHPVPDLFPETPLTRRVLAESHGGADEHYAKGNAVCEAMLLRAPELVPVLPEVDRARLQRGCRRRGRHMSA